VQLTIAAASVSLRALHSRQYTADTSDVDSTLSCLCADALSDAYHRGPDPRTVEVSVRPNGSARITSRHTRGVPGRDRGGRVGATTDAATTVAFCREGLASYNVPVRILDIPPKIPVASGPSAPHVALTASGAASWTS
jgi:hypothetical protein